MDTGLIIGWAYTKGELIRQRMDKRIVNISVVVSFLVTFIVGYPLLQVNIPFTGKIKNWLLLFTLLAVVAIVYYLLALFCNCLFFVYKKAIVIKEEEILFTDNKITSTHKTWILNSDSKKLSAVKLSTPKSNELIFKGKEINDGKIAGSYNIYIPVPKDQRANAQKIAAYFKNKLQ
jgi:hypothetical protein